MNRFYACFVFMVFCQLSFGQKDSVRIKDEILSTRFADPEQELILKSRHILLACVRGDSLAKAKEVLDYVSLRYQNSQHVCLWNPEEWLLRYWMQEYDSVLVQVLRVSSATDLYTFKRNANEPPNDYLFANLADITQSSYLRINNEVENKPGLSPEQKAFLLLHLQCLLAYQKHYTQEQLNAQADSFLAAYPASAYEQYVRQYIRHVVSPSKFGYGLDFYTGGDFFTGSLSSHLNNAVTLGHGFDFSYKDAVLYLRNHLSGASVLKKGFSYHGDWPQGLRVTWFQPEVSAGYKLHENRRFKFIPFAGASWLGFEVANKDRDANPVYKSYRVSPAFTATFGLNTDVKLAKTRSNAFGMEEHGYFLIRIRCGYNLPSVGTKRLPELSGNMFYFRVGIGCFGQIYKRRI